jgi:peptidoglycan/LPS O-acetylase OafA/YrhL
MPYLRLTTYNKLVNKLGYIPALDGLRAIAILGVMLYHLNLPGFTAGFAGVDLFFVLSGFLITSLLLTEHARTGRLDLARFYLRRVLRLIPALVLVLIAALTLAYLFGSPNEQTFTITGIWSSLLYVSNWVLVLVPNSSLGPLNSMWSLAVEDQFYIIWTPILAYLLSKRISRPTLLISLSLAALVSTLACALHWYLSGTFVASALGTDARAQALLVGCMLGVLYVSGRFPYKARHLMICAMTAALSLTFLITLRADSVLYTIGYLIIAIGAGCLIVLAISSPKVASLLSFKPLVWIGSLSYGLYLWHLLIYWYLSPPHVHVDPLIAHTIAFALSFVAAAASYYLFERYFLQLKKRVSARPATHAPAELAPSPPEPVRQSA